MGAKIENPLAMGQIPLMPVGSIVAWAKSLSGVGALPSSWHECDGSTVNGIVVPNLNGNKSVLVGETTSGSTTGNVQAHVHDANIGNGVTQSIGGYAAAPSATSGLIVSTGTAGTYTVVWIMRVA